MSDDDIVQRLRMEADECLFAAPEQSRLASEAADEIERLRAEVRIAEAEQGAWARRFYDHEESLLAASDEIERLRKAMAKWLDKWERMECEWCGHLQSGERREAER